MKKAWINKKYITGLACKWTVMLFSLLGFVGTFVSLNDIIPNNWKFRYKMLFSIIIIIIIFLIFWILCAFWFERQKWIEVFEGNNGCHIYVQYGDIFSPNEVRSPNQRRNVIIPVNRCFDTIIDDDLVSSRTLHGIAFRKLYSSGKYNEDSLNTALYTDLNIRQRLVPEDISNNEKRRGNLKRYSLGTVAEIVGESDCTYFFIALSTFDYNLSAHMDMWNSLLKRALDEKSKDSNRPASHFMIDPIRKKYLNIFCENFMVHCLEDSRASKCGGNYVLYAIDYDICNDNSIIYANQKDEFTAIRFIYDSVFQAYDCYFLKDRIKSYKCPVCNRIYDEKEVAQVKVKRCFECDEKLEEIIHKDVPISDGNYTEVEVKILGIIATLSKEDAMSAAEISAAVGCNIQKVAIWGSKVLAKKGLINIEKREARNYYYDKVD